MCKSTHNKTKQVITSTFEILIPAQSKCNVLSQKVYYKTFYLL
jgi:hypothetical protein